MKRVPGMVAVAVIVTGPACTVGPDYTRPAITTPDAWYEPHVQGVVAGSAHVQTWWKVFDDRMLAELIHDAQANNLDIQVAFFRIVEARAIRGIVAGDRYPQVDVTAEASTTEPSESATGLTERVDTLSFGAGLAWEIEAALNRLEVLVDRQPGALHERLADVQPIPLPPDEVAMGLPAELLRQRPDVRRAERELAAQTARIGVATADLYPRLSLTGFFASDAGVFGDLATGKSLTWGIGIPLRWQVFSGGKVQNQIRAEQARADQAFKLYEQSVLLALEEVQTALAAYAQERLRVEQLRRATDATQRAVDLVRTQYISGLTNFQNVLDTQRTLFQLQQQLASSEGTRVQSLVDLYRALGGGWDIENPDVTPPPAGLEQDAEAGRVYTILPPSDS